MSKDFASAQWVTTIAAPMPRRVIVFDTSVLLSSGASAFSGYDDYDIIVIPLVVLEEIDNHKNRQDVVGLNARQAIRFMDTIRDELVNGATFGNKTITVHNIEVSRLQPDDRIIQSAVVLNATLVSCDVNMRVKASARGLKALDIESSDKLTSHNDIYGGVTTICNLDENIIADAYKNKETALLKSTDLSPNEFVVAKDIQGRSALLRWRGDQPATLVNDKPQCGKLHPRNKEQRMALDLLLDPAVDVVTIVGKAGCGYGYLPG